MLASAVEQGVDRGEDPGAHKVHAVRAQPGRGQDLEHTRARADDLKEERVVDQRLLHVHQCGGDGIVARGHTGEVDDHHPTRGRWQRTQHTVGEGIRAELASIRPRNPMAIDVRAGLVRRSSIGRTEYRPSARLRAEATEGLKHRSIRHIVRIVSSGARPGLTPDRDANSRFHLPRPPAVDGAVDRHGEVGPVLVQPERPRARPTATTRWQSSSRVPSTSARLTLAAARTSESGFVAALCHRSRPMSGCLPTADRAGWSRSGASATPSDATPGPVEPGLHRQAPEPAVVADITEVPTGVGKLHRGAGPVPPPHGRLVHGRPSRCRTGRRRAGDSSGSGRARPARGSCITPTRAAPNNATASSSGRRLGGRTPAPVGRRSASPLDFTSAAASAGGQGKPL